MRFDTVRQDQAAIDDLFADAKTAVAAGYMDFEEVADDYRIVEAKD